MVENFHRSGKHMKDLDHYLKPPLTLNQQREKDALAVKAMFDRRIARQKRQEKANGAQ
jgi:hypothetical protein